MHSSFTSDIGYRLPEKGRGGGGGVAVWPDIGCQKLHALTDDGQGHCHDILVLSIKAKSCNSKPANNGFVTKKLCFMYCTEAVYCPACRMLLR